MITQYTAPKTSPMVTKAIQGVFYWRLVIIGLIFLATIITGCFVWKDSEKPDKLKNFVLVLTGGSIVVGIFYSIINYEQNKSKFHHDVKNTRDLLTFTTACKMNEMELVSHFKRLHAFYDSNLELFNVSNCAAIHEKMMGDLETRTSFLVCFNYLENIAIGVQQEIMDEAFMSEFLGGVLIECHKMYGNYHDYARDTRRAPKMYKTFTDLAIKWKIAGKS